MRKWCSLAMADFQIRRAQKEIYLFRQDDDAVADVTLAISIHLLLRKLIGTQPGSTLPSWSHRQAIERSSHKAVLVASSS